MSNYILRSEATEPGAEKSASREVRHNPSAAKCWCRGCEAAREAAYISESEKRRQRYLTMTDAEFEQLGAEISSAW